MFKVNHKELERRKTHFTPCSRIFIVNFKQANVSKISIDFEVLTSIAKNK